MDVGTCTSIHCFSVKHMVNEDVTRSAQLDEGMCYVMHLPSVCDASHAKIIVFAVNSFVPDTPDHMLA